MSEGVMGVYLSAPTNRGDLLFMFLMLVLVMCLLAWAKD